MKKYHLPIRIRLTAWHVAAVGVALLLYSAVASLLLLYYLRTELVSYAIQDIETIEGLLSMSSGRVWLDESYHNHSESRDIPERLLEVWSAAGELLFRNRLLGSRSLGPPPDATEGVNGYSPQRFVLPDGTAVQRVSRRHSFGSFPTVIRLAYSEETLGDHFKQELGALLIPLPFVLALAGAGGYFLARRALEPVHHMARRAEVITSEHLDSRLPVEPSDGELADLARVFNGMLSRLEKSFEQLRRFTSDASHELRTPLAAIRSVGEVGLQKPVQESEYRDIIGSMLEETNRLTQLTDNLLLISRADAGQVVLNPTMFRAVDLLQECATLFEALSEERSQKMSITGDDAVEIKGDWLLLRQAVFNVVHNALKYSPEGGLIEMRVAQLESGQIVIEVADQGPGIPEDQIDKVFDRFYRVDTGRSRGTGGTGLGLAIAKWIVDAHAGKISVSRFGLRGCTVEIRLPKAALITRADEACRTPTVS